MSGGEVLFEAEVAPHRSLSRGEGRVLLVFLGLIFIVGAGRFVRLGAWPVAIYGLAEALIALGLLHLHRRAMRRREWLCLTEAALTIRRRDAAGRISEQRLAPSWLGVRLVARDNAIPRLVLHERGREWEVGASLAEAEKCDLARALEAALHRARHPRFENPQLNQAVEK